MPRCAYCGRDRRQGLREDVQTVPIDGPELPLVTSGQVVRRAELRRDEPDAAGPGGRDVPALRSPSTAAVDTA